MTKVLENEIRFKIKNEQEIIHKLKRLGWTPKEKKQEDTYFCDKKLVEQKLSHESQYVIRIRKSNDKSSIAYKSFYGNSWIEIESGIENPKSICEILERLNQAPYLVIEKKRLTGKLNDFEINVDDIKNLGVFIELELISEREEDSMNSLSNFAISQLGLSNDDIIKEGYVQLMEKRLK